MSFNIFKINDKGVEQIKLFLQQYHKRPDEVTTPAAMAKWVADAESQADMIGQVLIEIPEDDSVDGDAFVVELDKPFVDIETISEEKY